MQYQLKNIQKEWFNKNTVKDDPKFNLFFDEIKKLLKRNPKKNLKRS